MKDCIHTYCDEPCHLEHDHQWAMVLGAIWRPASHRATLDRKAKAPRKQYGFSLRTTRRITRFEGFLRIVRILRIGMQNPREG